MNAYIALLRGINVGGHNRLPMKGLRTLLEEIGYNNVGTYIQSGNVVFQAEENDTQALAQTIREKIKKKYGFEPAILVLASDEMREAVKSNPFPEAVSAPKSLHLNFLFDKPKNPDLKSLEDVKKESEQFELKGNVFYLHAPDGIGRSKLAGKLAGRSEKVFGTLVTSRNWRTIQKITEMIEESGNT